MANKIIIIIKRILRKHWKPLLGITTISVSIMVFNNLHGWFRFFMSIVLWINIFIFFDWRDWVKER